jgi:hypothetical protein
MTDKAPRIIFDIDAGDAFTSAVSEMLDRGYVLRIDGHDVIGVGFGRYQKWDEHTRAHGPVCELGEPTEVLVY